MRAPENPLRPEVRISSPTVLGSCDAYSLDFLASTGSGGRDWTNRSSYTVTSSSSSSSSDSSYIANVVQFLAKNWQLSQPITLPVGTLAKGQSYNFIIILCNFLGSCGQSSRTVSVLNTVYPTVSILGMQTRTINRNASLSLSSQAFTALCDGSLSQQNLTYTWSVSSNGVADPSLVSESKSVSKFLLSPYRLQINKMYTIKLTVLNTNFLKSSSASVQVFVQQGDLVAIIKEGVETSIKEGDRRKWSLHGSGSYDTDFPTASSSGLTYQYQYQWTCLQLKPYVHCLCTYHCKLHIIYVCFMIYFHLDFSPRTVVALPSLVGLVVYYLVLCLPVQQVGMCIRSRSWCQTMHIPLHSALVRQT